MIHSKIGAGSPREVVGFEFCSSVLRGVTNSPRRLGENVLATEHGERGTFHADGPYDLLRLLRCDLRCSLSPSAPEGRSGITGAYCNFCGLRYERSTTGWCTEAAGAGAHSLFLYRGLTTTVCTQALSTHRVCHGLTDLWAYR